MPLDVSTWKLLVWGVATFGVAGTIAFIVFFPLLAKAAGWALVRFFTFVFSYRLGCAVVAAIVACLITDYVRRSIEDDRHAAELKEMSAAFRQAQALRDARIAKDTRELVLQEIAAAKVEDAPVDKEVKDFTDALPKPTTPTGNLFRVGDDACRLRSIVGQGQAGCGPIGPQGVSKTDAGNARLRDRIRKRLSGGGG